ncbi:MAG: HAMP domain-containing protein [Gammaproteobacteria bacterium]|jgi:nitrogen fixation/metabolism regulation signal transduction histidine kinase|nr:HAMP domain-containing protein [Gammaproteobacteria bacterium]MBT4147397.1 HAMP domain-containing protein [Gammaproteobacteria bacterium]MBT5222227.1 HAMP domain-containing protein [Gammaproteobacteria bacterium]MBT5826704.1 HAMP domain-containing protein [Gammaproteobacteria bacterium]MBT6420069.1 HAMP domain-containing protein [Gammaproteobacteria bacterium]
MVRIKIPFSISILFLLSFIVLSLQLMSSALQDTSQLGDLYTWLLLSNAVGTVCLLVLVSYNIFSLARRLKKREAGSRLTRNIVLLFIVLTLVPAGTVFYFSMKFLHQSIDSWFNVELDAAMEDALELSQASLEQRVRWNLRQSQRLTESIRNKSLQEIALEIEQLREIAAASEVTLLSKKGKVIAFSGLTRSDILPSLPVSSLFFQVQQGEDFVNLASVDDRLVVQAIVAIEPRKTHYLQIVYPVPERIGDLTDSVEFAYVRFQEMTYLRHSLKISFSLVLSLVLLMSFLAAVSAAFISVRGIISPIRDLVRGTQAVAAGYYEQLLPAKRQDDLGFLVESFNEMVRQISRAQDETRKSTQEIERQRAYLETLLTSLTSGVLSFDSSLNIRTANQAANIILHVQVMRFYGRDLAHLARGHPDLMALVKVVQPLLEKSFDIWQRNIVVEGPDGRKEIVCQGAPLFSAEGGYIGAVLVFDDITDLIQAQKNAAWSEVARRLAHEIKNPLTPIQLSAERLQHKLLNKLDGDDRQMLSRSTRTIIQQVEAMKHMVDDFSEYAQPTRNQTTNLDLPALVQEVVVLYAADPKVEFEFQLGAERMLIKADAVSIRQLLHNMFKNALEAMEGEGKISIKLQTVRKNNSTVVQLAIYDTGCGIDINQAKKIFEPYVTNKQKGTGLGLAIVKKVIEEHGGTIRLDSRYKQGAGFIMQFPAVFDETQR